MPRVSVVTPNYNGADWIGRCIASVRGQSFDDWEHIIVDDASTDTSVEQIRAAQADDDRIVLLVQDRNLGPREARNRGTLHARGRYIAFLDSDDYWLSEKLARQLEAMRVQCAPISAVAYEVRDMHGRYLRRRHMPRRISYRRLLCVNLLSSSTTVYDTHRFGRVLNDCPWGDEDHHLWLRMLRNHESPCAQGVDEVLAVIVERPGSRSSNKARALQRRWQTYRRAQSLPLLYSCLWFACYACESVLHRALSKLPWMYR